MIDKPCPQCQKPISLFSKGALKGTFSCPHCNAHLRSRPALVPMAIAGGVGGAAGVLLGIPLSITLAAGIILSYPFTMRLEAAPQVS